MAVKTYTFTLDLAHSIPVPSIVVRVGDYDTNAFNVTITNEGEPFDLTGWTPQFEARLSNGAYIKDDGKQFKNLTIVDAKGGVISYTLVSEAFSTVGTVEVAYFSFTKPDASLQNPIDIVSTRNFKYKVISDAATGAIGVAEHYISQIEILEWQVKESVANMESKIDKTVTDANNKVNSSLTALDKKINDFITKSDGQMNAFQKKLNALDNQLKNMDVVKKSGDTMSGALRLQNDLYQLASQNHIFAGDSDRKSVRLRINDDSLAVVPSKTNGGSDWDYTKEMRIGGDSTNLLKKTGDVMTGYLTMSPKPGGSIGIGFKSEDNVLNTGLTGAANGQLYLRDWKNNNKVLFDKLPDGTFNVFADNLLKKTGDVMTGPLKVKIDASNASTPIVAETLDGSIRLLPWSTANYIQSGTVGGEAKDLIISGNSAKKINKVQVIAKEFIVEGVIKQSNDTDWMNLTLINGATVDGGRTPRYKLHNNVVYIDGAVAGIRDNVSIATLPAAIKPARDLAFPLTYLGEGGAKYVGELTVRADGRLTTDWLWKTPKTAAFCITYHL